MNYRRTVLVFLLAMGCMTTHAALQKDYLLTTNQVGDLVYTGTLSMTNGLHEPRVALLDATSFTGPKLALNNAPFSVVVWVKPFGLGSGKGSTNSRNGMIVANGSGYYDGFRLFHNDWPAPRARFEIGRPTNGSVGIESKNGLSSGYWNCVIATWDGQKMRLYLNGALEREEAFAGPLLEPKDPSFRIGYANYGVGSFVQAIERVQIYTHALSGKEVEATMGVLDDKTQNVAKQLRDARSSNKSLVAICQSILKQKELPNWLLGEANEALVQLCRRGQGMEIASALLRKLIQEQRENKDATLQCALQRALCESLVRENKWEEAVAEYEKLLKANPAEREAYASVLWRAGKRAEACEQFALLRDQTEQPISVRVLAAYAMVKIQMQREKVAEAKAAYEALLRLGPVPAHLLKEAQALIAPSPAVVSRHPWKAFPKTPVEFYVAPDGNDANDGSKAKPFATLLRARDAVRARPNKNEGATVFVRGGRYAVRSTLDLDEQDSGQASAPIVYRACPGERPIFDGGFAVKGFEPVTDSEILTRLPEQARAKVVVADLKAQGYDSFETQRPYGRGEMNLGRGIRELFADGVPMTIARWPNIGWLKTGPQTGSVTNRAFLFADPQMKRWSQAKEAMVCGYFYHLWSDCTMPVSFSEGTITFREHLPETGLKDNHPFFVLNLLEEIDQPGEWYYDCATGKLYWWKPDNVSSRSSVVVSRWNKPFLTMKNVKHLSLSGFIYEYGQQDGLQLSNGSDIVLVGCMVRRVGGQALSALNMKNFTVYGNSFNTLGHAAMRVSGGDRKSLTSGNILIENNEVFGFARRGRTYNPALFLDGCGARVVHNHFHHGPSSAMRIEGNDHLIEYNQCNDLVTESDDQGAIDMWCNVSYRGTVIRYNLWKDIGGGANIPCGQAAIRFDDAISGSLVYGNYFENTSNGHFGGVQIHGGQFNILDNNIFIDCAIGVSFSSWGNKRWNDFLSSATIQKHMADVNIEGELYRSRYPELPVSREKNDQNSIWRNLFIQCGQTYAHQPKGTDSVGNQIFTEMPRVYKLAEDSVFTKLPPRHEMGRYDNGFMMKDANIK